jgi:hypothetical protein
LRLYARKTDVALTNAGESGAKVEEFSTTALRQAVAVRFPDAAAAPLVPLEEGWDCAAYRLGGQVIVKRPKRDEAAERLRYEALVLATVRPRVSLPVPDLHLLEDPLLSWHAAIPGERLEAAGYEALSLRQREDLAAGLAQFQAEVHQVSVPAARPVEAWAGAERLLAAVPLLPDDWHGAAGRLVSDYAALPPDPLGEVFGQFDGHGWNMAFDHAVGQLNGIYDFGDSGVGARHRDFIYCGLTSLDLMERTVTAYGALTGLAVEHERVRTLSGAHRLWELAEGASADRSDLIGRFGLWVRWQ